MIRVAGVTVLLLFACGIAGAAQLRLEDCVPSYADGDGGFNVGVSTKRPTDLPPATGVPTESAFGTATFTTHHFGPTTNSRGKTVVAVNLRNGSNTYLSFDATKSLDVKWLNERLIYIEAWWGRLGASELVFDALEGRFLYRKIATYGLMAGPECGAVENPEQE